MDCCYVVVKKTFGYTSQASVCECAPLKSCLMGSHMWKRGEKNKGKGESEFILHKLKC